MSTKLPDIGGVPSSVDPNLRRFLSRLREHVQELRGNSGDLAGRAGSGGGGGGGGGGTTVVVPGPPAPAPGPADPPDPTPPPTPSGVNVVAGIDFIGITTDPPTFTQGHGYGRTRVYGIVYGGSGPLPTFGTAVLQHEFVGQVGTFPVEPAQQWHIWVTWRSVDGYESAVPFGGTNGVQVTTGQDPSQLLDMLAGQLSASQLVAALNDRINLIDAGPGVPGSVDARVATLNSTISARLNAGGDVANAIAAAQTASAAAVTTANAAASTVTTVQSLVQGGGPNLLRNSGFETDTNADGLGDEWTLFVGNTGDVARVHALTRPAALYGVGVAQRLQITSKAPGNTNDSGILQLVTPAAPGQVLTLSGYMRSNGSTAALLLRALNSGGVGLGDFATSATVANAAVTRFKRTATMPANTARVEVHVRGISNVGEWVEVDSLQLEEAADATGYNPGTGDVNLLSAAVQQEISTRASVDGYLGAQYTLRLDVNGRVVGFGISNTSAPGAGSTSEFAVVADRFSITAPAGSIGAVAVPFAVQTFPVTMPSGETLPAGVYMDAAYIRNLNVALARFNQAIITSAMIASLAADKITAGSLGVGSYIQSSAYAPGGAGFRISGTGDVDIANTGRTRVFNLGASGTQPVLKVGTAFEVLADGTASFAGDISSNNATLRGSLRGGNYTGYAWPAAPGNGFYLGPEGLLLGNFNNGRYLQVSSDGNVYAPNFTIINGNVSFNGTGTFAGNLSAAGGTFAGNLSAAGGTFSGVLTADAVNAVNTINLAGDSVIVPAAAEMGAPIQAPNLGGWTTLCTTGSVDPDTGRVFLVVSLDYRAGTGQVPAGGGGFTTKSYKPSFRVLRDGVTQVGSIFSSASRGLVDTPGDGNHTYTLQMRDNTTDTGIINVVRAWADEASVIAIGAKR